MAWFPADVPPVDGTLVGVRAADSLSWTDLLTTAPVPEAWFGAPRELGGELARIFLHIVPPKVTRFLVFNKDLSGSSFSMLRAAF